MYCALQAEGCTRGLIVRLPVFLSLCVRVHCRCSRFPAGGIGGLEEQLVLRFRAVEDFNGGVRVDAFLSLSLCVCL